MTQVLPVPGVAWEHARPEELGWSVDALGRAGRYAERIASYAVVVVASGRVIGSWGAISDPQVVQSIRKSLLNALVGILEAEGRIRLSATLEELEIDDHAQPLTADERQATVEHLLQSRSGIYLQGVAQSPLHRRLMPGRGKHRPGEAFFYNNWGFNALGTIVERAAGKSIFELFAERIAEPLEMEDFSLDRTHFMRRPFSEHPAYHVAMSARDLARFGLLFARLGNWGGQQLIPADWITRSVTPHSWMGRRSHGYGYLWLVGRPNVPGAPYFAAAGGASHTIFVMPSRDCVVVHRVRGASLRPIMWSVAPSRRRIRPPLMNRVLEAAPATPRLRASDDGWHAWRIARGSDPARGSR